MKILSNEEILNEEKNSGAIIMKLAENETEYNSLLYLRLKIRQEMMDSLMKNLNNFAFFNDVKIRVQE